MTIAEIRGQGDEHRVVLEFSTRKFNSNVSEPYVKAPIWYDTTMNGQLVYFSPHFYWPGEFAAQGRPWSGHTEGGATYPNDSKKWNKIGMEEELRFVKNFADDNDVHGKIIIGEFGATYGLQDQGLAWNCNCSNPSHGADEWTRDVTRVFNQYNRLWLYHS